MKTPAQISIQYAAVKAVLDTALQHSGGVYEAGTYGRAINFRQKAYAFRKAYREAIHPAVSPYEALILREVKKGETSVRIEPDTLPGTFTPASGPALTTPSEPASVDDPLLEDALALRRSLDL